MPQHTKTGQKKAFGSHGDKIWSCSNDYDDEVTYKKGGIELGHQNQGVCAGFSANWCFKILSGVRDIDSRPEPGMAMILQRLYDWQDYRALCARAGLAVVGHSHNYAKSTSAAHSIEANAGQYLISLKGHAVAACVTAGGFKHFFDPNFGCYKFNTPGRLHGLLAIARKAVGIDYGGGIRVYTVTLA